MRLYDTHCHLNAEQLLPNLASWIQEAKQAGVVHMNIIGWDESSSEKAIQISQQYKMCHAVIGLHPVNDDLANPQRLDFIEKLAKMHHIVAIGEIGLDYYWKKDVHDQDLQKKVFIAQINLANQFNLPIVVHCRDAYEDALIILKQNKPKAGGVMHCYAGPISLVDSFIKLGMHISVGGPITYKKNDALREMIQTIPLKHLLIETDAPYLSPEPFRGKINHPARVKLVMEEIVKHRKESKEFIEGKLLENSINMFHVKDYE